MALKLYSTLGSPAVRSTLLTIRAIGIKDIVELIPVNLLAFDHHKPEFVAKNPLKAVPVLQEGNFILQDSHAINAYLVSKYATDDALYPKDLQKRALVDSMAHFDSGILFARALEIRDLIFKSTSDDKEKLNKSCQRIDEAYLLLDTMLKNRSYVAGDDLSIADFNIVTTVSTLEATLSPLDEKKFPNIASWYKKMQALPYYSINEKGVKVFKEMIQMLHSQNLKSRL